MAKKLAEGSLAARTAARHGADVHFDWDDPATHPGALTGVDRLYLVTPVMRVTYADQVAAFLDLAEAAGVRHVTYLSTYGADQAPPQADIGAVEADLAARSDVTHSVLRPAWVMQNFADAPPAGRQRGDHGPHRRRHRGLRRRGRHRRRRRRDAGRPRRPCRRRSTRPPARRPSRVAEVADIITAVTGRPVAHHDLDPELGSTARVAAGVVPADYAVMLRWLTGTIISGDGSTPNADVERVTGRPPTAFLDFARRKAHAWTAGR